MHYIMDKYEQPRVLGEVLLGVILGPSIFSIFSLEDKSPTNLTKFLGVDTYELNSTYYVISFLAELAAIFLLFEVGVELEIDVIKRVGKTATIVAFGGMIIPFISGMIFVFGSAYFFKEILVPQGVEILDVALFISTALTATSVGISIKVFIEMNQLSTKVARVVVAAAIMDDIISLVLLTLVITYIEEKSAINYEQIFSILFLIVGFFIICFIFHKFIFPRFVRLIENTSDRYLPFMSAIAILFFFSWLALEMHVAPIIGAFIAGVIMSGHKDYVTEVKRSFTSLNHWITPIFFISVGLKVNIKEVLSPVLLFLGIILTILAIYSKIIGGMLGSKPDPNITVYEGKIIGTSLASRGEVTLIFGFTALSYGIFTQELFSMVVLMVILNAIIIPFILKRMFDQWEEKVKKEKEEMAKKKLNNLN